MSEMKVVTHKVKDEQVADWMAKFTNRDGFRKSFGINSVATADKPGSGGSGGGSSYTSITVTHLIDDMDKAWAHYHSHDHQGNGLRKDRGAGSNWVV